MRLLLERILVVVGCGLVFGAYLIPNSIGLQRFFWERPQSGWLYVLDVGDGRSSEPQVLLVDPTVGRIKGVLQTDRSFNSEIALSPDGTRLYVLHITPDGDELVIIATATGTILRAIPAPPKIQYIMYPHLPSIAISPDGNWLYMVTMRSLNRSSDNDVYSVVTFDVGQGVFLSGRAPILGCGPPLLLPLRDELQLAVLCTSSNNFHQMTLGPDGAVRTSSNVLLPKSGSKDQRSFWEAVKTGVLTKDNRPVLFMGNGRVLTQKNPGTAVTTATQVPNVWVRPRAAILSPDGTKIFVGIGTSEPGGGPAEKILVLDSVSLRLSGTITTSQSFWSLASSNDGRYLYAPTLRAGSLLVIDTLTRRDIAEISGISTSPAVVLVAP